MESVVKHLHIHLLQSELSSFSKAIDPVWYKDLLAKLPMFGLYHTLIKWVGSFLSDRSFVIRVDDSFSNPHSINAGVPQGSVISLALFVLFINYPLSSTSTKIHSSTFASDSQSQYLAYTNILSYRGTSTSLILNILRHCLS